MGGIFRFFKNDYITLSEGDVINIKSNYYDEKISPLLNISKTERLFNISFYNFLNNGLNFNFTFLIEIDPL